MKEAKPDTSPLSCQAPASAPSPADADADAAPAGEAPSAPGSSVFGHLAMALSPAIEAPEATTGRDKQRAAMADAAHPEVALDASTTPAAQPARSAIREPLAAPRGPTVGQVKRALESEGAVPLPGAHTERSWGALCDRCDRYRFTYPVELRALVAVYLLATEAIERVAKDERWMTKEIVLATEAWFIRHGWGGISVAEMGRLMVEALGDLSGLAANAAPAGQEIAWKRAREDHWLHEATKRIEGYLNDDNKFDMPVSQPGSVPSASPARQNPFVEPSDLWTIPLAQPAGSLQPNDVDYGVLINDLASAASGPLVLTLFMQRVLHLQISITVPTRPTKKFGKGLYQKAKAAANLLVVLLQSCAVSGESGSGCAIGQPAQIPTSIASTLSSWTPAGVTPRPLSIIHSWLDTTSGQPLPYWPGLLQGLRRRSVDAATALATARRAALLAVDMLIDPLRAADEPPRRFFEHMHYVYIERRLRSSKTDAALSLWNRAFFEKMSEAETPLRGHVRHCLRLWKLNTSAGKSLCNLCR